MAKILNACRGCINRDNMVCQVVYGTNCKDDINNIDIMFVLNSFKSEDTELISSNFNSTSFLL